jgi:hypothetical protein
MAGATGRLGSDPNGDPGEYGRDRFRTAGSGFQFSDITLDSSGGYSLFAGGNLSGVTQKGIILRYSPYESIELTGTLFSVDLFRTPSIESNTRYRLHLNTNRPTAHFGDEINLKGVWYILTDLTLILRTARFNAGEAYKILYDVDEGDTIEETSFSLEQRF